MFGKNKIKNFLFSVVIFDILIAPYIQYMIIPASLILLLFIFVVLNINFRLDLDFKIICIIAFCAFLSTLISVFLNGSVNVLENIKYFLQLISSFLYFYAFKWYGMQHWSSEKFIKWPVYLFVTWYFYLVVNYFFAPFETIDLIQGIYGRTTVLASDFEVDMRFPYLFSDPNTSIYFFLLALGYLFYSTRDNFHLLLLISLGGIASLACQSSGGMIAWIIMVLLSLNIKVDNLQSMIKIAIAFGFVICILIFSYSNLNVNDNFFSILNIAIERLGDTDRNKEGGGRLHHWENLTSMYPLPFGRGHVLFDEGLTKFPHSDLLGIIYRYGWIASILFFVFLFLRRDTFVPFSIAALIPFLINALIEDQKLFGLYLIFIGYISGRFIHHQGQVRNAELLKSESLKGSIQWVYIDRPKIQL